MISTIVFTIAVSIFSTQDVRDQAIFNLPAIAGKSPKQVVRYLGNPDRIEQTINKGRTLEKYFWKPKTPNFSGEFGAKEHSIVFVDGKADWINIAGTGDIDYDIEKALQAIKITTKTKPSVVSKIDTRWENGSLRGFRYLSIGNGRNGKVSSILVRVFTEP